MITKYTFYNILCCCKVEYKVVPDGVSTADLDEMVIFGSIRENVNTACSAFIISLWIIDAECILY